jgi:hypothetical protein
VSSSRRRAHVKIGSPLQALEVTLLDSRFGVAAHGFGGLDAEVDPGIYELQLRAGPMEQSRLLKLEAGAVHEETNVSMPVRAVAPLDGTTTSREPHQHAAVRASQALRGSQAGVIVMLRNLPGERFAFNQKVRNRLRVVGPTLEPLPGRWEVDRKYASATWVSQVAPGGIALRLERAGPDDRTRYEYRPLWIVRGWQVLVFVPNTVQGPAPELATIHMARRQLGWEPWNESGRIGVALELALWGLRVGLPVVPRDLLDLLLRTKFQNPILGIVGAHALLAQPKPNIQLLDTVLGNLESLLGADHPDLAGLTWQREEARRRRPTRKPPPLRPVSWPPTFLASYRALLRLDPIKRSTLAPGSQAERAAARLEDTGVWTSWAEPALRTRGVVAADDPARERVAEYVQGVAALHRINKSDALGRVNERQTALAVGLPLAVVLRALNELRSV